MSTPTAHAEARTNTQRPHTYFLQEAVDRGLAAIAHRLDSSAFSRPYFLLRLLPEPQLEHHIWDLGDMCGRFTDAYLLGRQMTGTTDFAEEEQALRKLLHECDPFLNPFMAGRMLIAFVDLYLASPSDERRKTIEDLAAAVRSKLVIENDYAYWFKNEAGWNTMEHAVFGDFNGYPTFPLGGIMLALARFTESVPVPACEDLLDRMCRFVLNVSGTFDEEGRYKGHTHSGGILTAAAAIMRRALRTNDRATVQRMKFAFDWTLQYSSSWGWVPDGLGPEGASCESCCITDAIHLGLLIARHLDSGYYAIVERFARNQLMENQFVAADRMLPAAEFAGRDRIAAALHGSWASWSAPSSLDNCTASVEGCCLGAGVRACFLVWDDIVTKTGGVVRVNMNYSRNSDWLEVIGFQPYEGKLALVIHDAPDVQVRIPDWASRGDVSVAVQGKEYPFAWSDDGYIAISGLQPGQQALIAYPLRIAETIEQVSGSDYRVKWRGDTVVAAVPAGSVYPLYEREWMERDEAPLLPFNPYGEQRGGPVHW